MFKKITIPSHLFLSVILLICAPDNACAQQASLQGIISDNATGQALYGANVVLKSMDDEEIMGAATDGKGLYSISGIDPGTWTMRISYVGYVTHQDTLSFSEGENKTVNVVMNTDDAVMEEVVVEGTKGAAIKEEGRQRITPVDLARIPSPATGDLVTYLQTLPGVVAMGDRGGQVFIRGGTPSQNMALVDGAIIYKPAHIVGFYSPFPEDLIAGADFYAGGFGPRYTGRISSVLDIQMQNGNRFEYGGSAALSPFAAEVLAEGPIQEGKSSWILSVRNSHIDDVSKWYPIEQQPLKFQSQFLKGSYIDKNARCSAMAMHTYDRGRMDFDEPESIKWRNFIFGGKCVALPEESKVLLDTNVNLSHYTNSVSNVEPFGFTSSITRLNLDLNMRQYVNDIRLEYGFLTNIRYLNYDLGEKFVGIQGDNFSQFTLGAHINSRIPVGQTLHLQTGTAVLLKPGDYGLSFEPRFRFTWQPFNSENQEVTGAAGIYRQSVVGISDMRDLSSVFTAWMNVPIGNDQMEAIHAILGWQQMIGENFSWSIEGYYKWLSNITVPVWSTIARFTTDLALADGQVYGSDLRLEYNSRNFYGLIGYGYSWTKYSSAQDHFNVWFGEPIQEYHPPHDRRHQLNALVSYDIGDFTFGARWQIGSGFPFTQPLGFDDLLDFRERLPDVTTDRGTRRVILDKPYQGRMPTVHRLDVSVKRGFDLSETIKLNLQLGAINAYDQRNIFYYDVFTHRRIDQLPLLPYLTIETEVN